MIKSFLKNLRKKWHRDLYQELEVKYNNLVNMMLFLLKQTNQSGGGNNDIQQLPGLCDIYGSDKGSLFKVVHTYTDTYHSLFYPIRDSVKAVFECGIGTNNPHLPSTMGINGMPGASLRVWRDYFKNAVIIGADIDRNILFDEERIHTGYIDQCNQNEIGNFFSSLAPKYPNVFDIMIDDGLHTFDAAVCLFENAYKYLNKGGYYIIEDMGNNEIVQFKEYFKTHINHIVDFKIMSTINKSDNNLIIIQKHD